MFSTDKPRYPLLPPINVQAREKLLELRSTPRGWLQMGAMLGKARLGSVVVATTGLGFIMAPHSLPLATTVLNFAMASGGTAMAVLAANAGNQIIEVESDAKMMRTRLRLLPAGVLTRLEALGFATSMAVVGPALVWLVNPLAGALAAANIALYTVVYTPLKRMHPVNTWVGALVGAVPPLIGWAAATGGSLGSGAWVLGALLYLWQMPHFLALSWILRFDYARGGYKMLSNVSVGDVAPQTLWHALALHLVPIAAVLTDLTTPYFLLDATLLNAVFAYVSYRFYRENTDASASRVFRHSIVYILIMSLLAIIHRKQSDNDSEESQETTAKDVESK
jgi:heme o synthase